MTGFVLGAVIWGVGVWGVGVLGVGGLMVSTTRPVTQPTVIPAGDAPRLGERVGRLEVVTIRYSIAVGGERESWDVVIRDRELLGRLEAMRRSEWVGGVVWSGRFEATVRSGGVRYVGGVGYLKLGEKPYGLQLSSPDGRSGLFVETGEAAVELSRLVEAEAKRQRPGATMVSRP